MPWIYDKKWLCKSSEVADLGRVGIARPSKRTNSRKITPQQRTPLYDHGTSWKSCKLLSTSQLEYKCRGKDTWVNSCGRDNGKGLDGVPSINKRSCCTVCYLIPKIGFTYLKHGGNWQGCKWILPAHICCWTPLSWWKDLRTYRHPTKFPEISSSQRTGDLRVRASRTVWWISFLA